MTNINWCVKILLVRFKIAWLTQSVVVVFFLFKVTKYFLPPEKKRKKERLKREREREKITRKQVNVTEGRRPRGYGTARKKDSDQLGMITHWCKSSTEH